MTRDIYKEPPVDMLNQLRGIVTKKNTDKDSGKGRIQMSKDGKSLVYTKRNGILFKFFAKAVNLVYKKRDLCDYLGIGDSHRQYRAAVFFKQLASQQRDIDFEIDKNTMNVAKLAETFKKIDLAPMREPVQLLEELSDIVVPKNEPVDSYIAPSIAKVEKRDVLDTIFRNCGNDRSIRAEGVYESDINNFTQIDLTKTSVDGNTGLRLVYGLWKEKLEELNLDKDQQMHLLANFVSGSKEMLSDIANASNQELATAYITHSNFLAENLKNCIVRNTGSQYATEQLTSNEVVEMTGNFIDFAARYKLLDFTNDYPPVMHFSEVALFPALMSAVNLQRDSLETFNANIAVGGDQVLKNILAASRDNANIKLDTIPEQNRKDPVFTLQCQMDPLRGVLDYIQIGGMTSRQNRQGAELKRAGETFLLAVNAFVDQKGYRAIQAQIDTDFYNYRDLLAGNPNISNESFEYCTGYSLADFEPAQMQEVSKICQNLAENARNNGLHVETYIKTMKDVIGQHAEPGDNLLEKYMKASEQARNGFVRLFDTLSGFSYNKDSFMEIYLREVALPLTSFALDVKPTPDLDQMTEIAIKYALRNIGGSDLAGIRNSIYNLDGGVHEILACSRYITLQNEPSIFSKTSEEQRHFDKLVRMEPLRVLAKEVDKAMESMQKKRFDDGRVSEWLDDQPYNQEYVDKLSQNRKNRLVQNSAQVVAAINSSILNRNDSASQLVENEYPDRTPIALPLDSLSSVTPTAPPLDSSSSFIPADSSLPEFDYKSSFLDSVTNQSLDRPYVIDDPDLPYPTNAEGYVANYQPYNQSRQAETEAILNHDQTILSRYSFRQVAKSQLRSSDDETNQLLSAAQPNSASLGGKFEEEVANMALIFGGIEVEKLTNQQELALTNFYLSMRDCALAGKTDLNDLVGGNTIIVKALLADPNLQKQMTAKLNEVSKLIASMGTAVNLEQAASLLAGCVARIGEFELECRKITQDEQSEFNSEPFMRAAAYDLFLRNPGALQLFSEKMNSTDYYQTIFTACVKAEGKWDADDTELQALRQYADTRKFLPLVAYAVQAGLMTTPLVPAQENYCLKLVAADNKESRDKIVQEKPFDITDQLIGVADQVYKAEAVKMVNQAKGHTLVHNNEFSL